jgi:hypothetical protein
MVHKDVSLYPAGCTDETGQSLFIQSVLMEKLAYRLLP